MGWGCRSYGGSCSGTVVGPGSRTRRPWAGPASSSSGLCGGADRSAAVAVDQQAEGLSSPLWFRRAATDQVAVNSALTDTDDVVGQTVGVHLGIDAAGLDLLGEQGLPFIDEALLQP